MGQQPLDTASEKLSFPQGVQCWGLTGGIGCGKSTASQLLSTHFGIPVIDADQISRSMTLPGGKAMRAIEQCFGTDYLDANGGLNRERMRDAVFSNPAIKQQLEQILHPLIQQQIFEEAHAHAACGAKHVILDIPLLLESPYWRNLVPKVIVVDCLPEQQVQRVMQRSQLPESVVRSIMATQADRCTRLKHAHTVIDNSGSQEQMQAQVQGLGYLFVGAGPDA